MSVWQRISGWWKLIRGLCEWTYESPFGEIYQGGRLSHVTGCAFKARQEEVAILQLEVATRLNRPLQSD